MQESDIFKLKELVKVWKKNILENAQLRKDGKGIAECQREWGKVVYNKQGKYVESLCRSFVKEISKYSK